MKKNIASSTYSQCSLWPNHDKSIANCLVTHGQEVAVCVQSMIRKVVRYTSTHLQSWLTESSAHCPIGIADMQLDKQTRRTLKSYFFSWSELHRMRYCRHECIHFTGFAYVNGGTCDRIHGDAWVRTKLRHKTQAQFSLLLMLGWGRLTPVRKHVDLRSEVPLNLSGICNGYHKVLVQAVCARCMAFSPLLPPDMCAANFRWCP